MALIPILPGSRILSGPPRVSIGIRKAGLDHRGARLVVGLSKSLVAMMAPSAIGQDGKTAPRSVRADILRDDTRARLVLRFGEGGQWAFHGDSSVYVILPWTGLPDEARTPVPCETQAVPKTREVDAMIPLWAAWWLFGVGEPGREVWDTNGEGFGKVFAAAAWSPPASAPAPAAEPLAERHASASPPAAPPAAEPAEPSPKPLPAPPAAAAPAKPVAPPVREERPPALDDAWWNPARLSLMRRLWLETDTPFAAVVTQVNAVKGPKGVRGAAAILGVGRAMLAEAGLSARPLSVIGTRDAAAASSSNPAPVAESAPRPAAAAPPAPKPAPAPLPKPGGPQAPRNAQAELDALSASVMSELRDALTGGKDARLVADDFGMSVGAVALLAGQMRAGGARK